MDPILLNIANQTNTALSKPKSRNSAHKIRMPRAGSRNNSNRDSSRGPIELYQELDRTNRYVALSTAMQDVIYFMNLIDKMKNFGVHLPGVPNQSLHAVSLKTTWVHWISRILQSLGLEPNIWPFSYTIFDNISLTRRRLLSKRWTPSIRGLT